MTNDVTVPYRPSADPDCGTSGQWHDDSTDTCFNGYAFDATFDFGGLVVPEEVVYGVSFNTQTWGYEPIGVDGPYTSLNVGLTTSAPSQGIDVDPATWFEAAGSDPVFAAAPQEEGFGIAVRFDTVPAEVGAGTTIKLFPEADTFVSAGTPDTNFNSAGGAPRDYVDTYGGFNPSCVPYNAPAYGLLRFDLDAIPDGAVISDARIVTTTRAGYAQDGDPNHHAVFLSDDTWSENGVTWNNKPVDGTTAPGNPNLTGGGDIRLSPLALGSAFMFRDTCNTDFAGNQDKGLPDPRQQRIEDGRRLEGRPHRARGDRAGR